MTDDYNDADAMRLWIKAANATSYEEALQIYNSLVERCPVEYVGQRARFFEEAKQFDSALEDYDRAVALAPNSWLPFRAEFVASRGDKTQALADYDLLINLACNGSSNYKFANAFYMRARFYESESQFDLAEKDYEKAAQIDKIYLQSFAAFCIKRHLSEKYFACLNQLVVTMPQMYLGFRANYFERCGRFDEATVDFNNWVRVSVPIGYKDGYSPRAWALTCRANFFKRRGVPIKFYRDYCFAKLICAVQCVVGFSSWPSGEADVRCYEGI